MSVARQEWLDWEFDPPGFSQYGCDDIGDLLASGQMSIEFLDDGSDDPPMTAARREEKRQCQKDFREIRAELIKTVSYQDKETEKAYEDRISMQASLQSYDRERQRAKERIERGLPHLDHNPNAL